MYEDVDGAKIEGWQQNTIYDEWIADEPVATYTLPTSPPKFTPPPPPKAPPPLPVRNPSTRLSVSIDSEEPAEVPLLPPKGVVLDDNMYEDMAVSKPPVLPPKDIVPKPPPPPPPVGGMTVPAADNIYDDAISIPQPPPPPPTGAVHEVYEDMAPIPNPSPPVLMGGATEAMYYDVKTVPQPPPPPPIGGMTGPVDAMYDEAVAVPKPPPPPPVGYTADEIYDDAVTVPMPPQPPPTGGTRELSTSSDNQSNNSSPTEAKKPPGKFDKSRLEEMFTQKTTTSPSVAKKPVRKLSRDLLFLNNPASTASQVVTSNQSVGINGKQNIAQQQPMQMNTTNAVTDTIMIPTASVQQAWRNQPDEYQNVQHPGTVQNLIPVRVPDFIPMGLNPNLGVQSVHHNQPVVNQSSPQTVNAQNGMFPQQQAVQTGRRVPDEDYDSARKKYYNLREKENLDAPPVSVHSQQQLQQQVMSRRTSNGGGYASVRKKYYDMKKNQDEITPAVYDAVVSPTQPVQPVRVDPVYEPLSDSPEIPAPPPPSASVPFGVPAPPPPPNVPSGISALPPPPTVSIPYGIPAPPPPPSVPANSGVPAPPPPPGVFSTGMPAGIPAPPPPPAFPGIPPPPPPPGFPVPPPPPGIPAPPRFPGVPAPPPPPGAPSFQGPKPAVQGPPQVGGLLAELSNARLKPAGTAGICYKSITVS